MWVDRLVSALLTFVTYTFTIRFTVENELILLDFLFEYWFYRKFPIVGEWDRCSLVFRMNINWVVWLCSCNYCCLFKPLRFCRLFTCFGKRVKLIDSRTIHGPWQDPCCSSIFRDECPWMWDTLLSALIPYSFCVSYSPPLSLDASFSLFLSLTPVSYPFRRKSHYCSPFRNDSSPLNALWSSSPHSTLINGSS